MKKRFSTLYKLIRGCVRFFYPRVTVEGAQNLPKEPCIIVGNHSQIYGPIYCELFFPTERYTWCAGEMMHLKTVPKYAFEDFWSSKPKYIRPVYRLLSYMIAPVSVCLFNLTRTIGVYHDTRIISTFKKSSAALLDGASVVIFPEHNVPCNNIIYDFRDRFIDLAKIHYRKTKTELSFVPMYIAPYLGKMCLGKPIKYNAQSPIETERARIKAYLMDEITTLAAALPRHRVVPYPNLPKKDYKENIHEKAGC